MDKTELDQLTETEFFERFGSIPKQFRSLKDLNEPGLYWTLYAKVSSQGFWTLCSHRAERVEVIKCLKFKINFGPCSGSLSGKSYPRKLLAEYLIVPDDQIDQIQFLQQYARERVDSWLQLSDAYDKARRSNYQQLRRLNGVDQRALLELLQKPDKEET